MTNEEWVEQCPSENLACIVFDHKGKFIILKPGDKENARNLMLCLALLAPGNEDLCDAIFSRMVSH